MNDLADILTHALQVPMVDKPNAKPQLRFSSLPFCGREYLFDLSGLEAKTGMSDYFLSVGTTTHTVVQDAILRYALHNSKRVNNEGLPPLDIVRNYHCKVCDSHYLMTPIISSGIADKGCPYCRTPATFGHGGTFDWFEPTIRHGVAIGHMDDIWLVPNDAAVTGKGGVTCINIDYKTGLDKQIAEHRRKGNVFPKYGNEHQINAYSLKTFEIIKGDYSIIVPEQSGGYVAHPLPSIGDKLILHKDAYNITAVEAALIYLSRDNPAISAFVKLPRSDKAQQYELLSTHEANFISTRTKMLGKKPPVPESIHAYCKTETDFECKMFCPLHDACQKSKGRPPTELETAIRIVRHSHGIQT